MPTRQSPTGSELFIVDNSDQDWKVLKYLHDWCQISKQFDIATAYFEIGSLLSLKDEWRKVDLIRVLMGDEVSKRTQKAFELGLQEVSKRLDDSIESEKEKNDFLQGVPAIVEAIRAGKLLCRVYRKDKFHAKAYITHARLEVVGASALVGSSNFTFPGLTENIELNVQITGRPVSVLQEWYDEHWGQGEDVTPDILRVIERHIENFTPFDVYAKALQEFFKGYELSDSEWERNESIIYPILAQYQKEGYHGLMKRAAAYNGAFLCDGVGLGKTFVGLMLIERLIVHDRKNVALFVPKSARVAVWEMELKKRLPHLFGKYSKLEIFNHTDLLRKGTFQEDLESVRERADVIIIDEAHHFRNRGIRGTDPGERLSHYWRLFDICEDKTVFMLTATPINNRLTDLQHMIELFSRLKSDYFSDAPLAIRSLQGHFLKMEKALEHLLQQRQGSLDTITDFDALEAELVLSQDDLFRRLVVQHSRSYVKKSITQGNGQDILFPKPKEPKVVPYSVKQTYGKLLGMIEQAFSKEKPLFSLAIYYPYAYYKGDDASIDPMEHGRQKQVVSLVRTSFLKRFESSVEAFTLSLRTLLRKLLAWLEIHAETDHEKRLIERWKNQHSGLIGYMKTHQLEIWEDEEAQIEEELIPDVVYENIRKNKLSRDDFKIDEIIDETLLDLEQLVRFLYELQDFKSSQDKKLAALKNLLKNDPVLSRQKVIIFTEFMDTARYLKAQLVEAGIEGVEEIDSASKSDRVDVIRRFSPYYNGSSSSEISHGGKQEIRVLISTDVLSEGLNLQDATRLINYDLHWNPVRLMQRIGRVDRRLNGEIEKRIIVDHPDQARLRGEIAYWNFLPPDELDDLLRLYKTVSKKTLRISKTFGIEGKKLLKPDDDYEDLRDFYEYYEGKPSPIEQMHLEYQQLIKAYPGLEEKLNGFPQKVFSGRQHPSSESQAIFFCYALPAKPLGDENREQIEWSIEAGSVQWYLLDLASGEIIEDPSAIIAVIRSAPDTKRKCLIPKETLSEIRLKLEKHIKNTYLKKVQAPIGVKPTLKAWMELC